MCLLQTLPPNTLGRDFVVGDLHGCRFLLDAALRERDFNPATDRVFSVGDLIDRGPDSLNTLALLDEPWFYAVRGNHEGMFAVWMARRTDGITSPSDFIYNGGDWVRELDDADTARLHRLATRVANLPAVIRVLDEAGKPAFQVAHAELMDDEGAFLTDARLETEDLRDMVANLTWGRRLVRRAAKAMPGDPFQCEGIALSDTPLMPALSVTFVGHTIVRTPLMHCSHVYIDRGAFLNSPDSELLVLEPKRFLKALGEADFPMGKVDSDAFVCYT